MMRKNDLSVFKLEQEGFKITLKRGADYQPVITSISSLPPALPAAASSVTPAGEPVDSKPAEKLREIVSPMVGTFYASASPDSPTYASPGQEINEDSVVCIIEAMKVMNEIKAECRGVIVEVVAENGKPVQFGQVLFRVR
ncbi:MAG: accB [Chthoniobacteraceae bacterium]|nr:accB [Chthoniobacteraceae bacterium]